jgi:uncharacterized protein (DUF58 family)
MSKSPERVLQRLDWQVIRRLDGILQGDYRTLFYGQGLDLADIREYQFGDDIRHIDWNVTARLNSPYVRQYTEDREISAWFLLDLSPSVDFGTVQTLKRNMLIDFVATLARLLTRHGNRVGAILYDSQVERVIPAAGGRPQVLRIIYDLQRIPKLPHAPLTDLTKLLSAPGWDKPLNLLSRRHEVLCVRLTDPREKDLPDIGMVVMEDAETGQQLYIDTHDRKFRERFHQAAERREQELSQVFHRAGVDMLPLSTEDDLVKTIVRFAALRKQRKTMRGRVYA